MAQAPQIQQPSPLVILILILVLLALVASFLLIRFHGNLDAAAQQAAPLSTLLGVATLGIIAVTCVAGVAYGLSVGQTGSIQTIQKAQDAQVEQGNAQEETPAPDGQGGNQEEQAAQEQQAAYSGVRNG